MGAAYKKINAKKDGGTKCMEAQRRETALLTWKVMGKVGDIPSLGVA